ncbi:MAG: hypothetical protein PHX04_06805 [Bacilli bacterium]|nr:hypothetical protein [Bacilli bacterium]
MNEKVKFKFLISFLDSFRFGAVDEEFVYFYLDNLLAFAEDTLLECILVLKFKGFKNNADDLEKNVLIAKEYYQKILMKERLKNG